MNKSWYAVYTKPQCEKKVAALLSKKKIENFCPFNRITSVQGNRRKMSYETLFPSFVFVYISSNEMEMVRQTSDVLNFVYWLGKPAEIKAPEIEYISHFASSYYDITLEKIAVSNGVIRVSNEPHIDMTNGSVSLKVNRIRVSLPSLGFALVAEAEKMTAEEYSLSGSNLLA